MSVNRPRGIWLVAGAVAALVLGIATTVLFAATGAFRGSAPAAWRGPGTQCSAPALKGHVVDVPVGDMMGGMTGRPHWRTPGPGRQGMGTMYLRAAPSTVPAGLVSLRVVNVGALPHEVVVLPLSAGQAAGERPTGSDGKVSEAGSLGEASRSCGAGTGNGITPGTTAWTTLTLQPGRYELVCNFPGHYMAGMYTELDVTR
ncbi:sulfocyanin-like copper-binding protein [Streptomyces hirsutus]|uniref:sulfocyanin-like copper-binding protein n=1 Tax=Streptomyces hirsutus TaxID=35620 RepID=UPI00099F1231|nr:sulfocyanin-like copper-binding protein [Streptomyces hirsutus]